MAKERNERVQEMLTCITQLPKQIVTLHGRENMTEFLLHTLCLSDCFNLSKAAYFIDNPDFDHLKGISGYHKNESYSSGTTLGHWEKPEQFTDHMQRSLFNQTVRSINLSSIRRGSQDHAKDYGKVADQLSSQLDLSHVSFLSWPIKHDNHGFLVFESPADESAVIQEYLMSAVYLFGFCPVF